MERRRVAILGGASHALAAACAEQLARGNHDRTKLVGLGDSIHGGAATYDVAPEPAPQQDEWPELFGSTNWRTNFQLAKQDIVASPLPTRQLKRMAARGLARAVSSVQRIEERKAKKLAHKRARAVAAHEANVHSTKSGSTE